MDGLIICTKFFEDGANSIDSYFTQVWCILMKCQILRINTVESMKENISTFCWSCCCSWTCLAHTSCKKTTTTTTMHKWSEHKVLQGDKLFFLIPLFHVIFPWHSLESPSILTFGSCCYCLALTIWTLTLSAKQCWRNSEQCPGKQQW